MVFSPLATVGLCAGYPLGGGGCIMAARVVIDFAGEIVVHATAGSAALVCALFVGKRRNFPQSVNPPHSPILTMIVAKILWLGRFGCNCGSALAAGNSAGMTLLVTHIAAAMASLVWMTIEWCRFGRPSLAGIVIGMVACLATVTPASDFIGVPGRLILGLAGGVTRYVTFNILRLRMKIGDSLDVFAVHGVGGIMGSPQVAWLALPSCSGLGLGDGVSATSQFGFQFLSVAITAGWTVVASVVILRVISVVDGLRVD